MTIANQLRHAPIGVFLLGAVFVALVFDPSAWDVFTTPKLIVASGVTVLAAGAALLTGQRSIEVHRFLDGAALATAVWMVVATATSADVAQSLWGEPLLRQGLATMLLYLAAFYAARLVFRSHRELFWLFQAVAVAATVLSVYALAQRLGLDPIWDTLQNGRVFSAIGQPNPFGAYLAFAIPITIVVGLSHQTSSDRIVWWMFSMIQLGALLLTISRGAFLGLIAGLLVLATSAPVRSKLNLSRLGFATLGLVAVLGTLAMSIPGVRDTATQISGRLRASAEISTPGSVQTRLDLWRVAGEIVVDHPILGTGPDTFAVVFPSYRDQVLSPERASAFTPYRVESPHNVYLAAAIGSGLPGLASQMAVLFAIITLIIDRHGHMGRDRRLLFAAGLAAMSAHLVTDLFLTADVTGTWTFWVVAGALVAALPEVPPLNHEMV